MSSRDGKGSLRHALDTSRFQNAGCLPARMRCRMMKAGQSSESRQILSTGCVDGLTPPSVMWSTALVLQPFALSSRTGSLLERVTASRSKSAALRILPMAPSF